MGEFLQKSVRIEQVDDGIFRTLSLLVFKTAKGRTITIPKGYVTDGYSKPQWTQWIVGGRFEDDIRPSTIHDYLCQHHGFEESSVFIPVSFDRANDIFYEAMVSVGIPKWKASLMRFAVNFNSNKW